jgi:hypothetical protein
MVESNTETPAQEPSTSVTLIPEAGEGTIGVQLDETNEHTNMFLVYFSSLRESPVNRDAIYGETLERLIAQLEFVARMAGTLGFVDKSLGAEMSPEDTKLYSNIEQSVQIISDVIVEKFRPRPR